MDDLFGFAIIISQNNSCPFCSFSQLNPDGRILEKFEHCFVIEDRFPVSKGHCLIIPYNHISDWFSAPFIVQQDMMFALANMKDFLDKNYSPDGYNFGGNCGLTAGQTIFHLHLHLIPRYKGDMDNPRGGVRGVIPSKQNY